MHEREQLKHEIKSELRDERLRSLRNWASLAGLAMLVGGTSAVDLRLGCIVAGSLLFLLSVAAMVLARPKRETKSSGDDKEAQNAR